MDLDDYPLSSALIAGVLSADLKADIGVTLQSAQVAAGSELAPPHALFFACRAHPLELDSLPLQAKQTYSKDIMGPDTLGSVSFSIGPIPVHASALGELTASNLPGTLLEPSWNLPC